MNLKPFYYKNEKIIILLLVILIIIAGYYPIDSFDQGRDSMPAFFFNFEKFIPFVPFFVIFYISMYILAGLPILYIKKIDDYRRIAVAYLIMILLHFVFYILLPFKMDRPPIPEDGIIIFLLNLMYTIVSPYNLFPSMHVSLATFSTLIYIKYKKKYSFLMVLWLILIILSVLLIKQHQFIDVIGGLILSSLVFLLVFHKKQR